jgi:hypothetical protein
VGDKPEITKVKRDNHYSALAGLSPDPNDGRDAFM